MSSNPLGQVEREGQRRDAWRGAALVLPATAFTVLFFLMPAGVIVIWSLFRKETGRLITEVSLDNYARVFGQDIYFNAFLNSVGLVTAVVVLSVALAFPLAYVIATGIPARWQRVCLTLTVLPFWTSYVVRSYAWLLVLAPNGVINRSLMAFGAINEPLNLSFNSGATVLGFVHFFTMLCTLTIYASLVRIDPKLYLAAADLGASAMQTFMRVTLPLAAPGIAAGAFLTVVVAIGDYVTPQILGGNTKMVLPQMLLMQISRRADIPMASALSMLILAIVVIAYLLVARWLTARRV